MLSDGADLLYSTSSCIEWNGASLWMFFFSCIHFLPVPQLPCFSDRRRVSPLDGGLLDDRSSYSLEMSSKAEVGQ